MIDIHTANLISTIVFIVLIFIILSQCGTLTTIVIVSILTNIYLLTHINNTGSTSNPNDKGPVVAVPLLDSIKAVGSSSTSSSSDLTPYSEFFEGPKSAYQVEEPNPSYIDSSAPYYSKMALDSSDGDARMAQITKSMDRNEKSRMGAAAKTKDFYAKYYADELDLEENKIWWERFD